MIKHDKPLDLGAPNFHTNPFIELYVCMYNKYVYIYISNIEYVHRGSKDYC